MRGSTFRWMALSTRLRISPLKGRIKYQYGRNWRRATASRHCTRVSVTRRVRPSPSSCIGISIIPIQGNPPKKVPSGGCQCGIDVGKKFFSPITHAEKGIESDFSVPFPDFGRTSPVSGRHVPQLRDALSVVDQALHGQAGDGCGVHHPRSAQHAAERIPMQERFAHLRKIQFLRFATPFHA